MKRKKADLPLPSHSVQAEQSVLGGLMLSNAAWAVVGTILIDDDFYLPQHQKIYRAIASLGRKREPFDILTIEEELKRTDELDSVGGLTYLGTIARDTPSAANITSYAKIVRQKALARRSVDIASTLINESDHDENAVDTAIKSLMAVTMKRARYDHEIKDVLGEVIDMIDARYNSVDKMSGIPIGLRDVDSYLGGLSPGHLIVIAGRPAMGKTGMAAGIMLANRNKSGGIISAEMPRAEITMRMVSSISGVPYTNLRLGKISAADWPRINAAMNMLKGCPFLINDEPAPQMESIERQARKWKHEHDIKYLVVDYLQRIKNTGDAKRHEQVEEFARSHKEIARELEIPVILLSQVNRSVESREDKRPMMSDLRDSGAIEQEADVIGTIYRDEVYNDATEKTRGIAEFGVIKQRHGAIGRAFIRFDAETVTFSDIDCYAGENGMARGNGTDGREVVPGVGTNRRLAFS
jgi:replicative DNA helicase